MNENSYTKKIIEEVEKYLFQLSKTRAIQIKTEKRILNLTSILRRSLKSAADTGKERSDEPAWP